MVKRILLGPDGRARLGWRVLLYLLAFVAASFAGGFTAVGVRALDGPSWLKGLCQAGVTAGGFWLLAVLLRKKLDRAPVAGLGWSGAGVSAPMLGYGFAVGAAMILAVFAVERALGWVGVTDVELPNRSWAGALSHLVGMLFFFGAVGFVEELLFRGAIFQNLAERWPVWIAALVTGLLFALAHFRHEGFGPGFVISTIGMTVALVLVRLWTGSLAWAVGFHAAWDWTQSSVLGLDLQKEGMGALLHLSQRGPALWVGVAPEIEGGLLFVAMDAAFLVVMLFWARRRPGLWNARVTPDGRLPP